MRELSIMKAQEVDGRELEDVVIRIERTTTSTYADLVEQQYRFTIDAYALGNALFDHLPGGLLDRLLAYLLERKASHLVVSYAELARKES